MLPVVPWIVDRPVTTGTRPRWWGGGPSFEPDRQEPERLGLHGDPAGVRQLAQAGPELVRPHRKLLAEPFEGAVQHLALGEGLHELPLPGQTPTSC